MSETQVYIYDAAAGDYITVGKTVIPRVAYIGPFDSEDLAVHYLIRMSLADRGQPIPAGYALITMRAPIATALITASPPLFKRLTTGAAHKLDNMLRYRQAPKKVLKRKAK